MTPKTESRQLYKPKRPMMHTPEPQAGTNLCWCGRYLRRSDAAASGWKHSGWQVLKGVGRPEPMTEEHFWSKTDRTGEDGCWRWTGHLGPTGYAYSRWGRGEERRFISIHRLAYTLAKGPIPDGLTIDHLCRVRHCVNPDHLEAVTKAENTRRAAAYRRALIASERKP